MATITEKSQFGEQNIVDLARELKAKKQRIGSKEEIARKESYIEVYKRMNKKASSRIAYAKSRINKIEEEDFSDTRLLDLYEEVNNYNKKMRKLKKEGQSFNSYHRTGKNDKDGRPIVEKLVVFSISHMKNELNMLKGKDFYYRINDSWNKPYNIKRSEVVKMKDSSFFLEKYKKGLQKAIDNLRAKPDKDKREKKKLAILEDKLMKKVAFNERLIKFQDSKEEDLDEEFRSLASNAFNQSIEKDDSAEKLMTVDIYGELIEF